MTHRYYAAQLPPIGGLVTLDDFETHHALNVMRVRVGGSITLFDGAGNEASAVIQMVSKRQVICEAAQAIQINRENAVNLTMGIAMPKGDRAKELVERLTELGVNELVPIHCRRTQWSVSDNTVTKWHRVMIDACKQSGRNHLMRINSPVPLQGWLTGDVGTSQSIRYVAHLAADNTATNTTLVSPAVISTSFNVCVAIGPEGGFDDDELRLADSNGWHRLQLGNRVYRIETAAILAAIKIARL